MQQSKAESSANRQNKPETRRLALVALPGSLVRHVLSFLESQSLTRTISCCSMRSTGFNMHESQLEPLWRQLYLSEFEAESAVSPKIAIDGAETSWRVRLARRVQTEQNWSAGRSRETELKAFREMILSLAFDDEHILLGHEHGSVQILSANGSQIGEFKAHDGDVDDMAFNKQLEPPVLVSASTSHESVKIWNFTTRQLRLETKCQLLSCNIALHGHTLVFGDALSLHMYDVRDGKLIKTIELPTPTAATINDVRAAPHLPANSDGRIVALDVHWPSQRAAVGFRDGRALLADLHSGAIVCQTTIRTYYQQFHQLRVDGCGSSAAFVFNSAEVWHWNFANTNNNSSRQILPAQGSAYTTIERRGRHQFVIAQDDCVMLLQPSVDHRKQVLFTGRARCLQARWNKLLVIRQVDLDDVVVVCDFEPVCSQTQ